MFLPLLLFAVSSATVNAHGSHGHGHHHGGIERALKRSDPSLNLAGKYQEWLKRATSDNNACTEDQSSLITDIKAFQIATIPKGDTEAAKVWAAIQANETYKDALAIKPKGSPELYGDFSKVKYDGTKDPDCWWTYTTCKVPKEKYIRPDVYTCSEPSTWGLSFDDGPSCSHDKLYDFLADNKQLATMFFIGGNVLTLPKQAQRAATDGHEICHHTWSHNYMTSLSNDQLFAELYYPIKAIKQVVGVTVTCWRPPFGDVDNRVRAIAEALGLSTNLWDNDTFDWKIQDGGAKIIPEIKKNFDGIFAKNFDTTGTIVLDHEMPAEDMPTWIGEYPSIQKNFKHIVPIATCTNNTQVYRDVSLSYPTFQEYTAGKLTGGVLQNPKISAAKLNLAITATAVDTADTDSSSTTSTTSSSASTATNATTTGNSSPKKGNSTSDNEKAAAGRVGVSLVGAVGVVVAAALML
ncbi:carbohydrate esterase family 4 protein [Atractiella rhizophila]|nr:carbohydrate esterase family 4 protein [Atractiella rhizophila]